MAAYQQLKRTLGGTQQLTNWKEFHSRMSAIQVEPRRHTATHILEEMSWQYIRKFNWSLGDTQQLTSWKGFHGSISALQVEPKRHILTHPLEGISWQYISKFNWSLDGTEQLTIWKGFYVIKFNWSPVATQQLTSWIRCHGSMSALQVEPRRHTATHILEEML